MGAIFAFAHSIRVKATNSVLLQNAVKNEANGRVGLFYWNKKEAIKLMTSIGVTMPQTLSLADGFIHSIHEKGSPVNINVKKITETKQFKRFFGDWQNNPESASKQVRNNSTSAKKDTQRCPILLAQNQRFELWNPFTGYTISNRAPSTN